MHEVLVNCLFKLAQEKVCAMTIAVDLGRKATKQTNKHTIHIIHQNNNVQCDGIYKCCSNTTECAVLNLYSSISSINSISYILL